MFKIGDVVKLKCGGEPLIIHAFGGNGNPVCIANMKSGFVEKNISEDLLVKYTAETNTQQIKNEISEAIRKYDYADTVLITNIVPLLEKIRKIIDYKKTV